MNKNDIVWKPEYSVGHREIDTQHKYLFELCRSLAAICKIAENRLSMEQALLSLLDYVDFHFSDEEKYYRDHPEFELHRDIHQQFINQAKDFETRFHKHELDPEEVVTFLYKWLVDHIIGIDRRFFQEIETLEGAQ